MQESEVYRRELRTFTAWIQRNKEWSLICKIPPEVEDAVFNVGDELMVVYSKGDPLKHYFRCSDMLAQELEEAGIMSFPKVPQLGVQTP